MKLRDKIRVCAEVVGATLTDAAILVMAKRLEGYPSADVDVALGRCAEECSRRLALADILERLPCGHPGADEAWAIASRALDEDETVVWTRQMAQAWQTSRAVEGAIGQRMAFRETYSRLVSEARHSPPRWEVSLGFDVSGRARPILDAVQAGRLPEESLALAPGAPERAAELEPGQPSKALPSGGEGAA